ncbi:alpha/beta fold hydrolase [Stappia sp. BW2]|uniref:alpha/beta hydrolase family protein n=1 Tax=Stappia sp. BW2 TaxID=2592622 RepID=UPI0011DEA0A3|nr:alpha/beta fold hydrolase [Stappia sp. BW2]TYC67489.1 alpha/beta fold hydrolase [Stappia sp. BW2]
MKASKALAWVGAASIAVLAGVFLVFQGLKDFELSEYETRPIVFSFDGYSVSGTLHLPPPENTRPDPPPLVLLVHGDGPADRHSGGGYLPLVSSLLDSGFAVYSWDKPGVGESEGNWLSFSMADRARLAATALAAAKEQPELRMSPAGFLGFSQAGWVLPILAKEPAQADFFVIVGGAVNWLRQAGYYTRRRLERAGADLKTIDQAVAENARDGQRFLDRDFSYQGYLDSGLDKVPMPEDRFAFAHRNAAADSSSSLTHISAPVLTVHGGEDLNVDPDFNSAVYRKTLEAGNPANRFVIVPQATHALLRAEAFNYQLEGQMPSWAKALFMVLGRRAYAPGALDTITLWIKEQAATAHRRSTSPDRPN